MPKTLKHGDHVEWDSEAGRVRGVLMRKLTTDFRYKGYAHHAAREEPVIKSDKTDHVTVHKGRALKRIRSRGAKVVTRPRRSTKA